MTWFLLNKLAGLKFFVCSRMDIFQKKHVSNVDGNWYGQDRTSRTTVSLSMTSPASRQYKLQFQSNWPKFKLRILLRFFFHSGCNVYLLSVNATVYFLSFFFGGHAVQKLMTIMCITWASYQLHVMPLRLHLSLQGFWCDVCLNSCTFLLTSWQPLANRLQWSHLYVWIK